VTAQGRREKNTDEETVAHMQKKWARKLMEKLKKRMAA
jgi:hypothetical protein